MNIYFGNERREGFGGFISRMSMNNKIIFITSIAFIVFSSLIGFGVLSIDWVAIKPANILGGAYLWTFVTSIFMHGGFFHLFANMMSLFFVGSLVEKILGQKRYLRLYMYSGLFAGLLFVLSALVVPGDMNTYAVGASGALFGLIGVLIILTPDLPVYIMFVPISVKMKYAAPGMLVLLWMISIGAGIPIGNVAHLGGLLFGLGYGFVILKKFPRKVSYIRHYFR